MIGIYNETYFLYYPFIKSLLIGKKKTIYKIILQIDSKKKHTLIFMRLLVI